MDSDIKENAIRHLKLSIISKRDVDKAAKVFVDVIENTLYGIVRQEKICS